MNREEHRAWIGLKREEFDLRLKILAHNQYQAGFNDGIESNTMAMLRYLHDEFGFGDVRFKRLVEHAKKDVQAMVEGYVTPKDVRDGLVAEGCKSLEELRLQADPPIDRWIPVTERLPKNDNRVLCCTQNKKGAKNLVIGYYMDGEWRVGMNSNVIAWRILPPAYGEVKG